MNQRLEIFLKEHTLATGSSTCNEVRSKWVSSGKQMSVRKSQRQYFSDLPHSRQKDLVKQALHRFENHMASDQAPGVKKWLKALRDLNSAVGGVYSEPGQLKTLTAAESQALRSEFLQKLKEWSQEPPTQQEVELFSLEALLRILERPKKTSPEFLLQQLEQVCLVLEKNLPTASRLHPDSKSVIGQTDLRRLKEIFEEVKAACDKLSPRTTRPLTNDDKDRAENLVYTRFSAVWSHYVDHLGTALDQLIHEKIISSLPPKTSWCSLSTDGWGTLEDGALQLAELAQTKAQPAALLFNRKVLIALPEPQQSTEQIAQKAIRQWERAESFPPNFLIQIKDWLYDYVDAATNPP